MTQALAEPFSLTRRSIDPRADGATRVVRVTVRGITIERSVGGVRMRVGVPMAAYTGLVIAVRRPGGQAALSLRHDDPDLAVDLGVGAACEVARSARAWSQLTGHAIAVEPDSIAMVAPIARRLKAAPRCPLKPPHAARRSRFSRRRRQGDPARLGRSFAHEHEIIARR